MISQRLLKTPVRAARSVYRVLRSGFGATSQATTPAPSTAPPPPPTLPPLEVRVEETPNPDARKLVCGVTVVADGSIVANGLGQAPQAPWVDAVFALGGVRTIFATRDFITITREPGGPEWSSLLPTIEACLQEHLPR